VQTKNPRRHREGTCKQVQGIRAQGARASTTRSLRHTVTDNKQDGKHTNEGKVRAGRCRVRANREDMQCKHPGQAKCDPRMARTSAVWASSPGSCPKTWSCSRTCQAHNLLPSTWLQNVLARAIFHRLRLSEMVEEGPHGRTRTSSRVSFDNAMWHGNTVPHMYQQAMPAPWATPGAFPFFFALSAFFRLSYPKIQER